MPGECEVGEGWRLGAVRKGYPLGYEAGTNREGALGDLVARDGAIRGTQMVRHTRKIEREKPETPHPLCRRRAGTHRAGRSAAGFRSRPELRTRRAHHG